VKWNAHRLYGPARLPALLANWTLLSRHGLTPGLLLSPDMTQHVQPVLRLQVPPPIRTSRRAASAHVMPAIPAHVLVQHSQCA
jgi:hypothetical protein